MTSLSVIARMQSVFPTKFGIPRQSGLVQTLRSRIVFEPEFRNPDALRGLNEFSHIWLIWGFSGAAQKTWSPTVRPPRLGGNTRMGVFATRSPFRPNGMGLSSVCIDGIDLQTPDGPVIDVLGADLMDGTPIYDIKPYLPYTDSHPDAAGGFASGAPTPKLRVDIGDPLLAQLPEAQRKPLLDVLAQDPRPPYQEDPNRVYGMAFAGFEIQFRVLDDAVSIVRLARIQQEENSGSI